MSGDLLQSRAVERPTRDDILKRLLPDARTVLDIGANVGQYAALLAGLVGASGRVLAFEPEPRTYAMLASITRALGLSNVEPIHVALADFDGTARIARAFDDDGVPAIGLTHLAAEGEASSGEAPAARLDTLCSESLRVETCSFAKIDVEGSELLVLRGAATFLATRRPLLMIELDVAMSARYGSSPQATIAFLEGLGYEQWKPAASDRRNGLSVLFRTSADVDADAAAVVTAPEVRAHVVEDARARPQ